MENLDSLDKFLENFAATDFSYLFLTKDYSSEAVSFLTDSAKTLNYYKREGLMPERAKKSGFTFIELIWIRLVFELKSIGIKSELIQKIKNVLFEPVDSKLNYEAFKANEVEIEAALKDLPREYIELIKENVGMMIKNGAVPPQLQTSKLFSCLSYTLQKKDPVEIRFYKDDEIGFYFRHKNIELDKDFGGKVLNYNPYISISLTAIISFYMGKSYINPVLHKEFFSKDEILIFEVIKKEKPKSITVEFTPDNKIELIKIKNSKIVDINQRLSEIFLNNAYEEVTITTQKGKIVNCTKTKKIKPNNKNTG